MNCPQCSKPVDEEGRCNNVKCRFYSHVTVEIKKKPAMFSHCLFCGWLECKCDIICQKCCGAGWYAACYGVHTEVTCDACDGKGYIE